MQHGKQKASACATALNRLGAACEQSSEIVGSAVFLFSASGDLVRGPVGYDTARREAAWNGLVPDHSPELLSGSCVCGHPPHPGTECDGDCGCTTFESDEGMGWVPVYYIFNATSIHPQGPYPFGKAS